MGDFSFIRIMVFPFLKKEGNKNVPNEKEIEPKSEAFFAIFLFQRKNFSQNFEFH